MILDIWIYAKPAEWAAIDIDNLSPSAASAFEQAKTGRWKSYPGGYEVFNVNCSRAVTAEIVSHLTDVAHVFNWRHGTGIDELNEDGTFNTMPAEVLAVMRDHVEYDIDGNEISREPATYERPNWGHVFFGQKTRIFAGEWTDEFTAEFL